MKAFIALLACAFALSFTVAADAKSRKSKKGYRSYDHHNAQRHRPYRRPYSVGYNGLCQRDTGTATSDLNFRVGCDVEEFWKRQEENAGGHR